MVFLKAGYSANTTTATYTTVKQCMVVGRRDARHTEANMAALKESG